jgi:hypothetical protein
MPRMNVVFGAMTLARQVDKTAAVDLIKTFLQVTECEQSLSSMEIDSAFMYPARETMGLTEQLLGEIFTEHPEWHAIKLASKANPCNLILYFLFQGSRASLPRKITNNVRIVILNILSRVAFSVCVRRERGRTNRHIASRTGSAVVAVSWQGASGSVLSARDRSTNANRGDVGRGQRARKGRQNQRVWPLELRRLASSRDLRHLCASRLDKADRLSR